MSKVKVLSSQEGYNLLADYYDKKSKYWDSFEKDQVLPLLGDVKEKKILDVGAGTGRLAVRLANLGAEVTALDISEVMVDKLKAKSYKLKAILGEAENLPFDDNSFDIVIATFLIVHLKDLEKFFDEVYRVLKPDGLFLVTNINQRKAPEIKVGKDLIEVESYYHKPELVVEELESLAFSVKENKFIKEGDTWINQIVLVSK